MPFKCTWFFTMGPYGWSESLYNNASDFATAVTRASFLAGFRTAFMPTVAVLTQIRTADTSGTRSIFIQSVNSPGTGATAGYSGAWPFESVMCRLNGLVPGVVGRIFLRPGPEIPSAAYPQREAIPGFWLADSASWRGTVEGGAQGWSVLGIPGAQRSVKIDSFVQVTAGVMTIFVAEDMALSTGSRIRLSRVVPTDCHLPLNGVYTVAAYDSLLRKITVNTTLSSRTSVQDTGFVRDITRMFTTINAVTPLRIVSHRTGRVFSLPRGRRSRRRPCPCP